MNPGKTQVAQRAWTCASGILLPTGVNSMTISAALRQTDILSGQSLGDSFADDPRVVAALEEYLTLVKSGRRPDRASFLHAHSSIAGALAVGLDGIELVQNAAAEIAATGAGFSPIGDCVPASMLGEFRLVREVGRGGMGVVYEAEQLALGRRVALKVLPSTASLDPRHRQRFQLEAQAAAILHHEHIVPVYGIGFDQGVHYYAMQFIEGRSLTELIRELRQTQMDTPAPSERRDWRAVARFGLQAAQALEHAHDLGVIHRDIKPSNLMIDDRGHLWVTDFGLARVMQENPEVTATGDLVGTLRYMSPEQARGENGTIDARVDIYALGATLYEILTLQPAFGASERHQLLRQILHDEPVPPRRLRPSLPRDLETIVLKAMDKEPRARYGSAAEMAEDLNRFLEDRPVRARRPSALDRAAKWARRHRTPVFTAAATLMLALAVSAGLLWDANRRSDAVMTARQMTLVGQRKALEESLSTIEQILRPMAASASREAPVPDEMQRVFSVAIAYLDGLPRDLYNQPFMKEAVAKVRRTAGFARLSLRRPEGRNDYRAAIRIYDELAAERPGYLWIRTGMIQTFHEYANLLEAGGDLAASDAIFPRAVSMAKGLIADPAADAPCYSMGLADAFGDLAWTLMHRSTEHCGDPALALQLAQRAALWRADRSDLQLTVGAAHYRLGNFGEAALAFRKSIDMKKTGDAADWFYLAAARGSSGDKAEARRCFDRAIAWMQANPDCRKRENMSWLTTLRESQEEAQRAIGPRALDDRIETYLWVALAG